MLKRLGSALSGSMPQIQDKSNSRQEKYPKLCVECSQVATE
jgi:hypothetical protein